MSRPPSNDALADQLEDDRRAALRLVPVSRETEDRLAVFVELLDRWRHKTNLISNSTFPSVWTRHIADFGPAHRARAGGQTLGRPGLRRRFPGPRDRHSARGRSRRYRPLHRERRTEMRLPPRSSPRHRRSGGNSPRACRSHRPRKPRNCGRRDRASLRPLAAYAQIGETLDGARGNCRVSARRIS